MRRGSAWAVGLACVVLCGCTAALQSQPPVLPWTTGFWFWERSWADAGGTDRPVDVLFVRTGEIRRETGRSGKQGWAVWGEWPESVPPSREYWVVFRCESLGVPDLSTVPMLAREVANLRGQAVRRRLPVAGVQLDIDSPTAALPKYAEYLRESGNTEVGRRSARLALRCLTGLSDRFGREAEVRKAARELSNWLLRPTSAVPGEG